MLEEKIENLMVKRKLISNSSSFKEIAKAWSEIKKGYEDCRAEVKTVLAELDALNEEANLDIELEEDFDFDASFNKIKALSEDIKTCSVSKFVENIKIISSLKQKCLKYLSAEKAKVEEVK